MKYNLPCDTTISYRNPSERILASQNIPLSLAGVEEISS
ncbi:hypothetical protein LEP1GSC047_3532 [Leptospira inadai serovar Lyme str. 10]|uniref:Uncharacterized protein n=1 Tax=Leptospira inadai serovar Lyme str. 10 TaxID=1049790 RepID=V6HD62_9LEPT|nr:hypothetical protein LEP1GSC047_3532 [Leptospira inadai serovar Lyme str. 10]